MKLARGFSPHLGDLSESVPISVIVSAFLRHEARGRCATRVLRPMIGNHPCDRRQPFEG